MALIKSHRDLKVYQESLAAAMLVFELTKAFPVEERYSTTDQFRRASRSVAANIAEAWRKRRYRAHFVSKLTDAEGEAAESQVWAEVSMLCAYLTNDQFDEVYARYEQILSMLIRMINHADQWCLPPNS